MLALREDTSGIRTLADVLTAATGVSCDSRLISFGNVFVAVRGFQDDGNSYISEAISRGASAIVTEQPLDITPDIPLFVVDNARRSLAELCSLFYGHPGNSLRITGITGTNGKTTTAAMIDSILKESGLRTGVIGTDKISIADKTYYSYLTTPDPPTLQKHLYDMVKSNVTHVTMETSAQGLELDRVTYIPFHCGILTNISPDHLDFYDSLNAYVQVKHRFLSILAPHAPLCVNADDPECMQIAAKYSGQIITYGLKNIVNITATKIINTATGYSFNLQADLPFLSWSHKCNLNVYGLHNVYNALAATAACLVHKIPDDHILKGLANFQGVARRMQTSCFNGFTLVDDTALNPGSLEAVFEAARHIPHRRMVLVVAIRGKRGPVINLINAAQIVKWHSCYAWDHVIVTSSRSHTDSHNDVTDEEATAFLTTLSQANIPFVHFHELPDAISFALKQIKVNDLLVLLGAQGMDAGRSITDLLMATHLTTGLSV